jgi:o-succinylbenzoate synthase
MAGLKLERIEVAKFRIPLRKPHRVGGIVTTNRTGRLLRIVAADGTTAYGEATPLPGLHKETVEDIDEVLPVVCMGLRGRVFDSFDALAERIASRVGTQGTDGALDHPTVCFALQTAAMGLFAKQAGLVAAQVLSPGIRMEVPVCGFFAGNPVEAEEVVASGSLARHPCVKVKVGRLATALDRRTIEVLLGGLPPETRLRLDGNRSLTLDHALGLFADLPLGRIEFLEEPLQDPTEMAALNRQTRLLMGIDESLDDPDLGYLQRAPFVGAWVVKPALVGDWTRVRDLAGEASRHAAGCVISSCLETGVGLWAQAQMAAAIVGEPRAAGLGTNILMGADMLKPRFDATAGRLETTDWRDEPSPEVLGQLEFASVV